MRVLSAARKQKRSQFFRAHTNITYWIVHSKIVSRVSSRESEFPPTIRDVSSVGAISESRHLPIKFEWTQHYSLGLRCVLKEALNEKEGFTPCDLFSNPKY